MRAVGKKKRKAATDGAKALLVARVEHEKRWAYACFIDHIPFPTMAANSMRDPDEGGLGYYLPARTLRELVRSYRTEQGDIVGDRDEQRERDAITLDEQERDARDAIRRAREVGALDIHAHGLLLKIQERRAKLLGTDAPTEAKLDVILEDKVTAELNAMLARAGRPPLDATPKD